MTMNNHRGQSFLEFILILPVLFFLILFGLQIFKSIYEAQYTQEMVRGKVLNSIAFQSNGGFQPNGEPKLPQVVEEVLSAPIETRGIPFMGGTASAGTASAGSVEGQGGISIKMGMCRELKGDCQ